MITPQQALQRTIEHREIFFDEMLDLMRQIMRGEISPLMTAAILTGLRVKKETVGEITAAALHATQSADPVAIRQVNTAFHAEISTVSRTVSQRPPAGSSMTSPSVTSAGRTASTVVSVVTGIPFSLRGFRS